MEKSLLNVKDLKVNIDNKVLLNGVDLNINKGEIHVIMGQNGAGKSTLASAIMGNPRYTIKGGKIYFKDNDILEMGVDERARAGIFLAMQYPSELSGVSNIQFLKTAINSKRDKNDSIKIFDFFKEVESVSKKLEMGEDYTKRYVNEGFSGGEKKRNEIFQMLMLKPKLIILDEIDSGLDIDAIRIIGSNLKKFFEENKTETSILIITHYPRLLDYIKPDYVHIMHNGKIVKTGDYQLALKLENEGYDWLKANNG